MDYKTKRFSEICRVHLVALQAHSRALVTQIQTIRLVVIKQGDHPVTLRS